MFGDHKLLRTGVEAQAVVTEATYHSLGNGIKGSWSVHLSVPFPDGAGTLKCRLEEKYVGIIEPGDLVPVRYDPTDRSKIVVDTPALKAHPADDGQLRKDFDAERVQHVTESLRNASTGTTGTPAPFEDPVALFTRPADPLDRIQKLALLHESGALTDAEFAAEKAKILGNG